MTALEIHTPRPLRSPQDWNFHVAPRPARRLVVFIHGFKGKPVGTWLSFPWSALHSGWWAESDLLFVGYDSLKKSVVGVASELALQIPRFYPVPPTHLFSASSIKPRPPSQYDELVLVGHSLGGLILRRLLVDAAHDWEEALRDDPDASRPAVLEASTRLFSPASAGFRPTGNLGTARAAKLLSLSEVVFRRSPAFWDLQVDSELIRRTQQRTERLVGADRNRYRALQPSIIWAEPDHVVVPERYDTDLRPYLVDGKSHRSVCKPNDRYTAPFVFVETGALPEAQVAEIEVEL